ncbi:hypothetical protein ACFLXB_02795 [Chloroflexota bacterium]
MKFKTLMLIKAVVCLSFGFLLLVFPDQLLTIMGATIGAAGLFTARLYGAALVGNLMLTWYARDAEKSKARRAIILDLFIYDAIGFVVALFAVLNGTLNWLGWGIVAIYLFFTIGYGYFWFANKPDA